ncbi:NAD-dependent epimerase/dehydratase family protein [Stenotrophomonas pigmentata]|uniref:NAD-dependent epimerase/dehydratase family protein n=1 Tax=Stenotrophomonas pigmentata TaxID=3055080 RepID=UPI0026ED3566|nr:NAD(P)-dependent oxidoreductase [Stenotrophomonas sp. 610A2]
MPRFAAPATNNLRQTQMTPTSPMASCATSSFDRLPVALWPRLSAALDGKHLLLTGGTGFFGRWLLALLQRINAAGTQVRVSVVSRDPARFLADHPEHTDHSWLQWIATDIRSLDASHDRPVDLVVHAATDTSSQAHERPLEIFSSIVEGTRRVLDFACRNGARRVLLTGSGAQYGAIPDGQPVPESAPLACDSRLALSIYGESKRMQETLAAVYMQQTGIEVVMTRCFAFSGPGLPLDGHFAIGNFVRDALRGDGITLNSSGQAVRSYLHGADLAVWLLVLLSEGVAGRAYNVGSDQALSVAELADLVRRRLAPGTPLRILGRADGPRSYYVPAIDEARALGLAPWTSLDDSIDAMAAWANAHHSQHNPESLAS